MLDLEEALKRVLEAAPEPFAESTALAEARGRVLLEQVLSPVDLPPFDNAAVDGYAVRCQDVAGAGPDSPVHLRMIGRSEAGTTFEGTVETGSCVRIFTGSQMPRGADAVVMQEDTRADHDQVLVLDEVKPWESIRLRGEDVKRGAVVAEAGCVLNAGRLSLLAACGLEAVKVGRPPAVGLLATGSELREPGQPLAPGQIYESNRLGLATLLFSAGGLAKVFPIVPDSLEATRAALAIALNHCDIVVTSGGVSVGEMDFVREAFEQEGGTLDYWRVAIKPGRPFAFGRRGQKMLFGLPGNPVSALVTFLLLVRPVILRWQGARDVSLPQRRGVLAETLANPGNRRHFMRVKVGPDGLVRSAGVQASHALSSMASANGLVDMPPDTILQEGVSVLVSRIDGMAD